MVLLPQKKTQKKLRDSLNQLYVHLDSAGGSGEVSWFSKGKFDSNFELFLAWNACWTWIWSIWILSLCLLQNQHWHGWQPIRRTVMPTLTILFCLFCDDLWWLLSLLVINQRKERFQFVNSCTFCLSRFYIQIYFAPPKKGSRSRSFSDHLRKKDLDQDQRSKDFFALKRCQSLIERNILTKSQSEHFLAKSCG